MTDTIRLQPQPHAWLEQSVLAPHAAGYVAHLQRGRYAPATQRVYLCGVAHFARWLSAQGHELSGVNKAAIVRFVDEHLPHCDCPYPVQRHRHSMRAALARLLEALRADGAIPAARAADTHIGHELAAFDTYMRDVCGLAASTREQRCRIVGHFLADQFGGQPILITTIKLSTLRRFILGEDKGWSAGTIAVVGGALGCYLRYRSLSGDEVSGLRGAIPHAARWRLANLPEVELTRFRGHFNTWHGGVCDGQDT